MRKLSHQTLPLPGATVAYLVLSWSRVAGLWYGELVGCWGSREAAEQVAEEYEADHPMEAVRGGVGVEENRARHRVTVARVVQEAGGVVEK